MANHKSFGNQSWFLPYFPFRATVFSFHTTLTIYTNSHNTKWTDDFPIANNSLQWRCSNSMNQFVKWIINAYSYRSNKPIPCVFLLHQMCQFLVQLKHKVPTYLTMFYPLWIIVLGHENWKNHVVDLVLIQAARSLYTKHHKCKIIWMKNQRVEHHVKVHFAIWRLEFAKLH